MFRLLLLLICLPFYIIYFGVKITFYGTIIITSFFISLIKTFRVKNEVTKSNEKIQREVKKNIHKDSKIAQFSKYTNINTYKLNKKTQCEHDINPDKKYKYELTQLSDLQCKITIERIQELYREYGFNVKVIGVNKKKYLTEYELIFSREINQFEILSISDKIIENFSLDGVRIVKGNKNNRIIIQIPLKYEKHITEM